MRLIELWLKDTGVYSVRSVRVGKEIRRVQFCLCVGSTLVPSTCEDKTNVY